MIFRQIEIRFLGNFHKCLERPFLCFLLGLLLPDPLCVIRMQLN